MITAKLRELADLKAKVSSLEQDVASSLRKDLAGLPAQYGFSSVAEFVAAVKAANGEGGRRKPAKGTKPRSASKIGRRRRATITDETRTAVRKMVQAEKTGAEIAKALGISVPSVQNIKKALGLVRKAK